MGPFADTVLTNLSLLLDELETKAPPDYPFHHHSLYHGAAGLSFMYWRLYRSERRSVGQRESYLRLSSQVG